MQILKWLGLLPDGGAVDSQPDAVRTIAAELGRLDPAEAEYVAAFAYILGRVAHADLHVSDEERRQMREIVERHSGLPPHEVELVVRIALSQSQLHGGTENFLVVREFGEATTRAQKVALLRCLFEVCAADGSISTAEAGEIRQVSDELRLDREDYIAVRSRFRDRLAVLQKDDADQD